MRHDLLRKLAEPTNLILKDPNVKKIIKELKGQICKISDPLVWSSIEPSAFKKFLPPEIKSIWIFVLKKDVPSILHYHPNSTQYTVMLEGRGSVKIGAKYKELKLFDPDDAECWCIIEKNTPHEFYPRETDMVVISYHTCASKELIEIRCDTHTQLFYEP